mmetsp:Transcript_1635/g.2666  ORF Transcript_1635/g.2666 Transcript_1635/m.2666 type:complete len:251 (+) Transcript_1635:159-911(+)
MLPFVCVQRNRDQMSHPHFCLSLHLASWPRFSCFFFFFSFSFAPISSFPSLLTSFNFLFVACCSSISVTFSGLSSISLLTFISLSFDTSNFFIFLSFAIFLSLRRFLSTFLASIVFVSRVFSLSLFLFFLCFVSPTPPSFMLYSLSASAPLLLFCLCFIKSPRCLSFPVHTPLAVSAARRSCAFCCFFSLLSSLLLFVVFSSFPCSSLPALPLCSNTLAAALIVLPTLMNETDGAVHAFASVATWVEFPA